MTKVSIIMPAYNASKYIKESINSVIKQSFTDWELIIVNDSSDDDTSVIIESYADEDGRIQVINLERNVGAAEARNIAIKKSVGAYIAFLDSDDTWLSDKLYKQINFMEKKNVGFTCSYYDKIDSESKPLNKTITYPYIADYNILLKYCPGNSTVIYNSKILGKHFAPKIKNREDYLMWLKLIRNAGNIYCIEEVLSTHRVHRESLSANKASLLKYHWNIYRKYENLGLYKSFNLLIFWIGKSLFGSKY